MEFYTLASSSAGNAALVCHNDTRLLIDLPPHHAVARSTGPYA